MPVGVYGRIFCFDPQAQGPVHHPEWAALQRAAAASAGWTSSSTVPMPSAVQGGPDIHPHNLQNHHRQRHHDGVASSQSVGGPVPWADTWGMVSSPGQVGLVGAPEGSISAAHLEFAHHQQRQRSHSEHLHHQHHDQRQRQISASAIPAADSASAAGVMGSFAEATSTPRAPVAEPASKPSRSPPPMSDSPGSPTDITLALQNGELSAAARVFVPTNISPAKPPTLSSSVSDTSDCRSGAGAGGVTGGAMSEVTSPRPTLVASRSPGLRSSPESGGRGSLGLPLGGNAFGASWGVMGDVGTGAVGAGSAKMSSPSANSAARSNGEAKVGSSSLWGSLGMTTGASAVPPSGKAIWGTGPLLESSLSLGGDAKNGDSLSLLLAPATGSGEQAPADRASSAASITFSSPLALSSWGVDSGAEAAGAVAGDEFVSGLGVSLGGLRLDDADTDFAEGKAGQQLPQRNLFGAKSNEAAGVEGELSWG